MTNRDRDYLQTPEQWTRFLTAFAHELRTPLASLQMLADLLAGLPRGQSVEQEKRYGENIQEAIQDIQVVVGEAAELARLLDGRVQVRREEVHLEQLVGSVEAAVRPEALEQGIALTSSLDPALPRLFHTDGNRLQQALTLLLGAAVSHARSEVSFRLGREGKDLRVAISSNGAPFPEAALENLFGPFEEGFWTARKRGGRSLVLPLANELTRALGGTLHAGNRGGRPTFDLSLPAADGAESV